MKLTYVCLQATREGQASHAHVWGIVNALRDAGWECTVIEPTWREGSGKLARVLRILLAETRSMFGVRRADIVYVRDHPLAGAIVRVAALLGKPVFLEVNGRFDEIFIQYPESARIRGWVTRSAHGRVRRSTGVIAVTPWLADWAGSLDSTKPRIVVPNAADTDVFTPEAASSLSPSTPYAVYVGVLAEWQGIDTLLSAVCEPGWPEEVRLVIAGSGPLVSSVEEAAEQGLVDYVGTIPYREVPGLLAGATASLSPKNEVLGEVGYSPIKLYESMASGAPVLVSDFPGLGDTVRDEECGMVLPPAEPLKWAAAVSRLHDDPDLAARLGDNGREAAVARHSWAQRAEVTRAFIEENL